MNSNQKLFQTFLTAGALVAVSAAWAQQQPPARQRDNSSTLPTPAQSANPNSSSTSNDPGLTTPTTRDNSKLSHRDRTFFEKAAKSGAKEVQVSQAVLPNLGSSAARDFAQKMIDDHKRANEELKTLAAQKGVSLPVETDKYLNKWSKNTKDTEDEYLAEMKDDHKDAIDLFEKAAKSDDPDIAAFARKTLPTLQHHFSMLQTDLSKSAR